MKDRLEALIVKYWSHTLTVSERKELEQLLLKYPEEWIKMGLIHQSDLGLKEVLSTSERDAIADGILDAEAGAGKDHGPAVLKKRSVFPVKRAFRFALLLAGAGVFLFLMWRRMSFEAETDQVQWRQVTTTKGMKTNLRLSDGTEIWLNAGSSLKYPESFGASREVYLVGEAYFKVDHQPDRPFIIHTAKMDAKVLGTRLDVRAYPDEDFSSTSLISGKVKVILKKDQQRESFYLKPHQKIIYKDDPESGSKAPEIKPLPDKVTKRAIKTIASKVVLEPVKAIDPNTISDIAWRKNILVYENETLSSLSKRLSRWYDVQIILKDSTLAQQRFTGRADNVSLDKLLHILQMLKPFRYTVENDTVIIY